MIHDQCGFFSSLPKKTHKTGTYPFPKRYPPGKMADGRHQQDRPCNWRLKAIPCFSGGGFLRGHIVWYKSWYVGVHCLVSRCTCTWMGERNPGSTTCGHNTVQQNSVASSGYEAMHGESKSLHGTSTTQSRQWTMKNSKKAALRGTDLNMRFCSFVAYSYAVWLVCTTGNWFFPLLRKRQLDCFGCRCSGLFHVARQKKNTHKLESPFFTSGEETRSACSCWCYQLSFLQGHTHTQAKTAVSLWHSFADLEENKQEIIVSNFGFSFFTQSKNFKSPRKQLPAFKNRSIFRKRKNYFSFFFGWMARQATAFFIYFCAAQHQWSLVRQKWRSYWESKSAQGLQLWHYISFTGTKHVCRRPGDAPLSVTILFPYFKRCRDVTGELVKGFSMQSVCLVTKSGSSCFGGNLLGKNSRFVG